MHGQLPSLACRSRDAACKPQRPSGRRSVIKVMLADDEDLVRSGLRTILSSADDIEVVAEADDGVHVAELARQHRPHVVLLDIRMKTADGLTALRALRRLAEPPAVAMVTTFDVDECVE